MNILHVTSEVSPYSKSGGLADVTAALPKAQRLLGQSVSVLSPFYTSTAARTGMLAHPTKPLTLRLGTSRRTAQIHTISGEDGVRHFFLDIPALFQRKGLYGENGVDYPDNPLRYALLARAALALNLEYDHGFDVIHCHDWQTGLVPFYRSVSRDGGALDRLGIVYTIHNLAYQGLAPLAEATKLGVPKKYLDPVDGIEFYGSINPMKAGILFADKLTTVSPTYAEEICTEEVGAGLHGVLGHRRSDLRGILNGVDYGIWSPERDPIIPFQYTSENQNGKRRCKAELQTRFGLAIRPRIPIVCVVSRLAQQKGIDLLPDAIRPLLEEGQVQLVVLGDGDPVVEQALATLARAYPERVGLVIGYDDALAHLVFAGADIFAMPSRYEPCGLAQLYAMRYGTIPVVRDTGGLHDTVADADTSAGLGTGFRFAKATCEDLGRGLHRATEAYHQARLWRQLISHAMRTDFSWRRAAADYLEVYQLAQERSSE